MVELLVGRGLHIPYSRFGPTMFNDPMKAFTHLWQTTTIEDYKMQFEILSNQLKGLAERYKLSFFLSGLWEEIRFMVCVLNPSNLNLAFSMTKMLEENVYAFYRTNCLGSTANSPIVTYLLLIRKLFF